MNLGLIAVIITMLVIVGAVITKRCTAVLFIGSVAGAVFLYGKDFLVNWVMDLQQAVKDNVWLLLMGGLFGILIMLLRISKGTLAFSKIVEKLCKDQKSSLLAAFILGVIIFIDDYLNVLTVGMCMKRLFDKRKIPRETLAYLLDSTGAPVCVLIPFSSWAAFYGMMFMKHEPISSVYGSSMEAYTAAIPFMFYPIIALLIVLLFSFDKFPKLGAMKAAYRRVEETGMVYSEKSRKYNYSSEQTESGGRILDFVLPMGALIILCIVSGDILVGLVVAILIAILLLVMRKEANADDVADACISGFNDMTSILFLLVSCFLLQIITEKMGMGEYIIRRLLPVAIPEIFPAIAFVIVAVLTFATGSFWGMSALAIPVLVPVAAYAGANLVLVMAAIVSGGTFGSHACFFGDATVMSSKSSGIDNFEHVMSQLPYVLIGAALTVIGYLICGLVMV